MSYRKAEEILPRELIEVIQQYVDGENIYIPRKLEHRKGWGGAHRHDRSLMHATVPYAGSIGRVRVSRDFPRSIILQKRVYSGLSASIVN